MSEPQTTPGSGQETPPLVINAQYVRDLSFEAPNVPGIFTEMRSSPEISVSVDVQASVFDEERKLYEVRLKLNAQGKVGEKTAFIAELEYGAAVSVNAPAEHLNPLLLIEAPRHMFPFARNILSDLTRDGGFPPVVLQPIDFVALFRQRVQALQKQADKTDQGGDAGTA
ncbi:protein-export chaperone SecB [Roseospira marina]|uniref:Protein-export protein SecB n=1 Tax=Roseospira marina TaxID=140057 RepID=A0A5M6IGY9_9PROT|nr:protein-export chaperone SecB [Roseospira marina]KAA5607553.1 protein-export chaperone SecB [Roseospira marina]MBB4312259.1 preprotein translocase subunit SecB [Roseospira marina]MBB5085725.1 preprotein translocase subunit SecB [Roseospira marina]